MAFLTDQIPATGVNLTDLFHIVNPYDVSQGNPAGSSFKACFQQVLSSLTGGTSVMIVGAGVCSVERCGNDNNASGFYSTVSGGKCNTSSGYYSTVSGGYRNTSSGDCSTVSGGYKNTSIGNSSTVSGGYDNTLNSGGSFIGGGVKNFTENDFGIVVGGSGNTTSGYYAIVGNGIGNTDGNNLGVITGGYYNTSSGYDGIIGGGGRNTLNNLFGGVIGGGRLNTIVGIAPNSIGGGFGNNINTFGPSTISGGYLNTTGSDYSTIGGGSFNTIDTITSSGYYVYGSTIGGGSRNTISSYSSYYDSLGNTIAGGTNNTTVSSYYNGQTIGGGVGNVTSNDYTNIGGGFRNNVSGYSSSVGGGGGNNASGYVSTVGGGLTNLSAGDYSIVGGGKENTTTSCYSAILGGFGNIINHDYSGAFGCNILSVSACTFHVNYLALQDVPVTDSSSNDILVRDSATGIIKKTTIASITGDYLPLSGGTVTGGTTFTSGVTANTLNVNGLTQTSGITSTGGITFKQVTINSTYSATTQDYMIDVTGGTFTVYLPSAVGIQGRLLVVKNNGGGAVTVQPTLGQYIDGKPFVILGETNTIQLSSNGSEWVAISYNISTVNSSTGVFSFTGLTIASPTTFTVAPVKGWIVNDTTNPLSPQLYYVEYSGGTHTATYVTATTETWVYLTSGGTISQSNIPLTDQQRRQNIALGKLGHANKTSIINAFSQPDFVLSPLSQLRDMFEPINLINGGITTSANGANLSFNTSAGYLHGLGINFTNDTLNPNALYVTGTAPCTFQYRTQTGGTASNTIFIDPTKKDVGGVVTTISGTKATNQRIYLVQNGVFRVQYGQVEYSNLTQAIAGLQNESFVEFSNFTNNGLLVGILSVLSTATDLTDTSKAQFFTVSKFGDSSGAAGGTSTTTLQQAYNNSVTPEIVTLSALGALSVKNGAGTADNVTNVFEGVNAAGTTTSFVRADGAISATTFSGTSTTMSGTKGTTVLDGSTTTAFLTFSGSNTVGGTGYTDFIRVTNTAAGATTPNKTFRLDNTGSFEIINNAYNSTLLSLTDSGNLTVTGRVKSSINYSQTGGGSLVTLGASVTPQTILSVNLTTYGNPVVICAYGDAENTGPGYWSKLQLWRDSTALGAIVHTEGSASSENTPFSFTYIDAPAAGTYTYYLKANEINGGNIKFGESTAPILNAREL